MGSGKVTIEESPVEEGYELRLRSKKLLPGLMVALVIYVIVRGVAAAATTPFGYDELLTWAVSSQPSMGGRMGGSCACRGYPAGGILCCRTSCFHSFA